MRAWSTTTHSDTPSSRPTKFSIVAMLYPVMLMLYLSFERSRERFAQPLLVQFADARLFEAFDDPHDLRHGVLRNPPCFAERQHVIPDLRLRHSRRELRLGDHQRHGPLAPLLVLHADHGHFGDARMQRDQA